MDIKISINTDNDAFGRCPAIEISRILEDAAYRVQRDGIHERNLMDSNGNTVGKIEVED